MHVHRCSSMHAGASCALPHVPAPKPWSTASATNTKVSTAKATLLTTSLETLIIMKHTQESKNNKHLCEQLAAINTRCVNCHECHMLILPLCCVTQYYAPLRHCISHCIQPSERYKATSDSLLFPLSNVLFHLTQSKEAQQSQGDDAAAQRRTDVVRRCLACRAV